MKFTLPLLALLVCLSSCKENKQNDTTATADSESNEQIVTSTEVENDEFLEVTPISHATMMLKWDETIIYVDPVGGSEAFEGMPAPDLILVTDVHGDHLSGETLLAVSSDKSKIIMPQACADKLPSEFDAQIDVLNNGDTKERFGLTVEAIPMYNLREEALKFHQKGRGNGYVIEKDGNRVYIAGDTEDIPEMRNLKDIDIAFVCMNLPYTMTVESAASAVLDFAPQTVYPYHYRGTEGLSDVGKFKSIVEQGNEDIQVIQLDWYPSN